MQNEQTILRFVKCNPTYISHMKIVHQNYKMDIKT